MANDIYKELYNPDVLSCLANLSSDEVFTPPEIVNSMLDMLPQEIFESPDTKFLDPACKSGVFLREIAKRLIRGLEKQIPDLQERIDHIFQKQLYGIAITELTSLLARRTVYCSKYPNSEWSITRFNGPEGNIRFKKIKHTWEDGKCKFCGATESTLGTKQREDMETYAYEYIHGLDVEEAFKMKFDVIISNPPYHLKTSSLEEQQNADPIYQLFVEKAKKLKSRYICMIIPSRWMTGGKSKLKQFRKDMVNDKSIKVLHDFIDASECFPGVEIKGGVCYFLRDSLYNGPVEYYLHRKDKTEKSNRYLNDMNVGLFVRDKNALSIIEKVTKSPDFMSFETIAGSQTPFGIVTSFKDYTATKTSKNTMKIYGNKFIGYTSLSNIKKNIDLAYKWKVFAPKAVGDGIIETDKINAFVPDNPSVCTQTYIIYGEFSTKAEADNLAIYMKTKFFHFMLGQLKNTQQMAPNLFKFVPLLDFKQSWNDKLLYKKYDLSDEEIDYIESTIWANEED